VKRLLVIFAWMLLAAGIGISVGASLYGLLLVLLADPATRPATWPGWNLLFLIFLSGFPLAAALLALILGSTGHLPGTRRT